MSIDFNGTTDRIDYSNVYDAPAGPFTISCRAYPDVLNVRQYMMAFHQAGDDISQGIFWVYDDNRIAFNFPNGGCQRIQVSGHMTAGVWNRMMGTYDGSEIGAGIHIYHENTEYSYTSTTNGTPNACGGKWCIGGRYYDDARNFNGKLAEMAVWNRVLSESERYIVHIGSPRMVPYGLKFYVPLINKNSSFCHVSGKTPTFDGCSNYVHPPIIYPGTRAFHKKGRIWVSKTIMF